MSKFETLMWKKKTFYLTLLHAELNLIDFQGIY